ncbi:VgrG protein [Vibrio coralliilyticus]|nr:VgrG protein [Vibrio coralliilyticus]
MNSFEFTATNWQGKPLRVIEFNGKEALSQPYSFEITLTSFDFIDPEILMEGGCSLTLDDGFSDPRIFHGIAIDVTLLAFVHGQCHIKVIMVPRLWVLGLGMQSRVFLDMSVPEIITQVLEDQEYNGLIMTIDMDLCGEYPKHEYVCQFNESALAFVSRLMEKYGIYYYFEQRAEEECLCIRDLSIAHESKNDSELYYASTSGLDSMQDGQDESKPQLIHSFTARSQHTALNVHLKAYDDQRPGSLPEGKADVSDKGFGKIYTFSNQFKTQEEASKLAEVCAQQQACKAKQHSGKSRATWVEPGYIFTLRDHFLNRLNTSYLVTDVHHTGKHSSYLAHALSSADNSDAIHYTNHFKCIPASVQFRSQRSTPNPKIYGVLSAMIDGTGSGETPLLDKQGRYKVIMPFDLASGSRSEGKASHWLRLSQPYGGKSHGFHFPLLKGTEVLVGFIEGNPDLPVIQGAIPNPDNPSLVTDNNATTNHLKTAGGTEIIIDDSSGKQKVVFQCQGAIIELGATE